MFHLKKTLRLLHLVDRRQVYLKPKRVEAVHGRCTSGRARQDIPFNFLCKEQVVPCLAFGRVVNHFAVLTRTFYNHGSSVTRVSGYISSKSVDLEVRIFTLSPSKFYGIATKMRGCNSKWMLNVGLASTHSVQVVFKNNRRGLFFCIVLRMPAYFFNQ